MGYFHSKPVPIHPSPDPQTVAENTISRLKATSQLLDQRESTIQKDIDDNKNKAKERMRAGDKLNASLYLQKAKTLEVSLSETVRTRFNLSSHISTLESSALTASLVDNLQETQDTFRMLSSRHEPSYVKEIVTGVNSEMSKMTEVQAILAGPAARPLDISQELDELEEEVRREREIEYDRICLEMPSPPVTVPRRRNEEVYRAADASSGVPSESLYDHPLTVVPVASVTSSASRQEAGSSLSRASRQVEQKMPRVVRLVNGKVVDSHKT